MIKKKDIPLNLIKAIDPIAQENLDIIKLKEEENTFYSFIEWDSNSDYFFKIFINGSKYIGNYSSPNLVCEFKPTNEKILHKKMSQGATIDMATQFKDWINLIREINDTPSIHDDNFAKYYSDFYYNEYKIVDDDANTAPFNPYQQDVIDAYLDSLTNAIEISDENVDEATKTELINEIKSIKAKLLITTKNQVMKSITKIYGKIYKVSKPFGKWVTQEAGKQLISKLIEYGIEYAPKFLDVLLKSHVG